MNITFNPVAEKLIREKLETARYATPEDVVLAGLEALSRQEQEEAAIADFQLKIRLGLESADRGELTDGEAFFAELESEEAGAKPIAPVPGK